MHTASILANINRHITLTGEEENYLAGLLTTRRLDRKRFLLRQGQRCDHLSFVNTGILRAYFCDAEGRESTIMFALSDWWITDMHCFVNRLPAMLHIEAVEESEVLLLHKDHLDTLLERMPRFERFFRIIFQNAYVREQLRIIQNLSLSAEERYDNFLAKYPQVAAKVTQKQIASYLGITPEFLSAIRAGKSRR